MLSDGIGDSSSFLSFCNRLLHSPIVACQNSRPSLQVDTQWIQTQKPILVPIHVLR